MDIGQRTATLEAQMEARKEADKDLSRIVDSLSRRLWAIILLLVGNIIYLYKSTPGIDKALP